MMILLEINYFAALVAAIIYLGIAALWYSPLLFSHLWLEENRITAGEVERGSRLPAIGYAALAAFVLAIGLAVLIRMADVTNGFAGALIGLYRRRAHLRSRGAAGLCLREQEPQALPHQ